MDIDRTVALLKEYTDDPETLAEFYEAAGLVVEAAQERRKQFLVLVGEKQFKNALAYAKKHSVLSAKEEVDFVCDWCEAVLEKQPWEALETAREYGLVGITFRAAMKRSEDILASKQDVGPALDIARRERAGDADYRRRAARRAFGDYIRRRDFSVLARLVAEFREFFTDEEAELAEFLAQAHEECQAKRWARLKAS